MCTRSMKLGCFCVVFFEVLMCSPFVTNTVAYGSFCLACGAGCVSPTAKPVPWQVFRPPGARDGPNERARTGLALKCSRVARR
jgi:hypothetical protein